MSDECKWVPCSQVGVCMGKSGALQTERRDGVTKPSKAPRIKPTKAPRNKNKESRRTPKPTKPANVPLSGCGAMLSDNECADDRECIWESGYPTSLVGEGAVEYLAHALLIENESVDVDYVLMAYASLIVLFFVIVYRNLYSVNAKTTDLDAESTPLLIERNVDV